MHEIVYHTNYKLEDSYWWFIARNNIILNLINKLCYINMDEFIIDYGCGTGGFTKKLSSLYNVIGIDNSTIALDYCRKRGLNNVMITTLNDFDKTKYNIKAITMLDVIEHIEDDNDIVSSAYNLLPQGGYLIASVPAFQWLWSNHDILHMHYRRYNLKTIKNNFIKQGFNILYASYFNSILFLPALLRRLTNNLGKKLFKLKYENNSQHYIVNEAVDQVSPIINKLFTKLFNFENYILPKFKMPFGLSIFLIGKK